MKHSYYRLKLKLLSPLSIYGGAENTDKDVLMDAAGRPFIPGSSLAGVLRSLLSEADGNRLFGSIPAAGTEGDSVQSPVFVYDAVPAGAWSITQRDNVKLDQYRVAVDKHKFDYECIEPGAEFTALLELEKQNEALCGELEALLALFADRQCGIGSKTNRGLGSAACTVYRKQFEFDNAEEKKAWLSFDPFSAAAWEGTESFALPAAAQSAETRIEIPFRIPGGISIREYRTEAAEAGEEHPADYVVMRSGGCPVIPGTSWAGCFRSRFTALLGVQGEEKAEELFGYVRQQGGKTEARRSHIRFSDTLLSGGVTKKLSHNAVDRFSAKVKDGALFQEETYYGGSGCLRIELQSSDTPSKRCLGAVIADLLHGYLAVGGLSSIGRGIVTAEKIIVNGSEFPLTEGWEGRIQNAIAE